MAISWTFKLEITIKKTLGKLITRNFKFEYFVHTQFYHFITLDEMKSPSTWNTFDRDFNQSFRNIGRLIIIPEVFLKISLCCALAELFSEQFGWYSSEIIFISSYELRFILSSAKPFAHDPISRIDVILIDLCERARWDVVIMCAMRWHNLLFLNSLHYSIWLKIANSFCHALKLSQNA